MFSKQPFMSRLADSNPVSISHSDHPQAEAIVLITSDPWYPRKERAMKASTYCLPAVPRRIMSPLEEEV